MAFSAVYAEQEEVAGDSLHACGTLSVTYATSLFRFSSYARQHRYVWQYALTGTHAGSSAVQAVNDGSPATARINRFCWLVGEWGVGNFSPHCHLTKIRRRFFTLVRGVANSI